MDYKIIKSSGSRYLTLSCKTVKLNIAGHSKPIELVPKSKLDLCFG